MPVYEYECKQCSHRHEVMQRLSDTPVTICPACKGEVYRVISPSGISFKGEGWYITDYARKGQDRGDGKKEDKATVKSDAPAPATGEKKETAPSAAAPVPPPPPPSPPSPPKDKKG